jgi:tRNA (uracil-5-)-methyltransferase
MEEENTHPPPPPPPELAGEKLKREESAPDSGEKRKREESAPDASPEEAPPASAGGGDAGSSGGSRHPMWKTSLCSYFRRRGASAEGCSHGESCRYAHTEEELRPRPDRTWDPTSDRAKKLRKIALEAQEGVTLDEQSLDKCLVGLPRGWTADRLKAFLQDQVAVTSVQGLSSVYRRPILLCFVVVVAAITIRNDLYN